MEKTTPVNVATEELARRLSKEVDCIIPLTHQSIPDDRLLTEKAHSLNIPIILGGHDHSPHFEVHEHSVLLKSGMDSERVFIIDFLWKKEDHMPTMYIRCEDCRTEAPHPYVQEAV